jgi:hypothetical protein
MDWLNVCLLMDWKPRKVVRFFGISRTGADLFRSVLFFRSAKFWPVNRGQMILMLKWFLRNDTTSANWYRYTGGVSVDIIQNAMPIATSTTLIILSLRPFLVFYGEYPGSVPGLHTYTIAEYVINY